MSKFYDETMKSLQQAAEIAKGTLAVTPVEGLSAETDLHMNMYLHKEISYITAGSVQVSVCGVGKNRRINTRTCLKCRYSSVMSAI